jgi:hypothetical protein
MAKATTPASEKAAKPRTPRKAAVQAGNAVTKQEAGATAPVSLSGDQAAAGDVNAATTPPAAPAADGQADAAAGQANPAVTVLGRREGFFPGMGRFPADWKPAPRAEEPEPDAAILEQTTAETGAVEPLQSQSWGLPDIAEFPAELTLVNNTRNILVVRPLNTRLLQFSTKTVQCPTAKKYDAIKRELAGRAVRERWDSETGLQVKHGED